MDSTIRIDPAELAALANELGDIAPILSTVYPPDVSACQSWGVTDALKDFALELEENRREVQESIQILADGVIKTADDFAEHDASLIANFNRILPELK